jgi:hypothetical protein
VECSLHGRRQRGLHRFLGIRPNWEAVDPSILFEGYGLPMGHIWKLLLFTFFLEVQFDGPHPRSARVRPMGWVMDTGHNGYGSTLVHLTVVAGYLGYDPW